MSSIAYITDHKMIEFHRLNGHTSMIFWRPTSQKKFSNFTYGEYLFFLSKGTQKGKIKEKGIIGYARYTKEYVVSFEEMWKKFNIQSGYPTKESLHEAILKVAKKEQLPEKMHCLQLVDIVFFQFPIYLSEFHIELSKQVESYIYLDQENPMVSYDIIHKAASFGKDMWTSMLLNQGGSFTYQADIILLQNLYQQLGTLPHNEYEKKKLSQITKKFMQKEGRYLARSKDDFICYDDHQLTLYIPCLVSIKSGICNLQYCMGRYQMYKTKMNLVNSTCNILLLLDEESVSWQAYLDYANIAYVIHT